MSTNNLVNEINASLLSPLDKRQIASTGGLPALADINEHDIQSHEQAKTRVPLIWLQSDQSPEREDENITSAVTSGAPTPMMMAP